VDLPTRWSLIHKHFNILPWASYGRKGGHLQGLSRVAPLLLGNLGAPSEEVEMTGTLFQDRTWYHDTSTVLYDAYLFFLPPKMLRKLLAMGSRPCLLAQQTASPEASTAFFRPQRVPLPDALLHALRGLLVAGASTAASLPCGRSSSALPLPLGPAGAHQEHLPHSGTLHRLRGQLMSKDAPCPRPC